MATPAARRVENRVIGADANPYVALAATLACGYLGIKNRIEPTPDAKGDAYLSEYQLPRSLNEALGWLADEKDLHDVLGKEFITVYSDQGHRVRRVHEGDLALGSVSTSCSTSEPNPRLETSA